MTKDFIYLASASPRRGELLAQLGVAFETRPAAVDERQRPGEEAADYVRRLALAKADAVWRAAETQAQPRPVLGADTAVVLDGEVLGKPGDAAEAVAMLARLSGRVHRVLTAVAVRHEGNAAIELAASEVRFRPTSDAERIAYCATGEPLDKAGGYGIQGRGAVFVAELKGSYSGVVGLPLFETAALLGRFGLPVWLARAERSA